MRFLQTTAAGYGNGRRAVAISGTYGAIVLVAAVVALIDTLTVGGLAGVWLVLVTLPSSWLLQFLHLQGISYLVLLTLGGLAQAWLLWLGLRGKRLT